MKLINFFLILFGLMALDVSITSVGIMYFGMYEANPNMMRYANNLMVFLVVKFVITVIITMLIYIMSGLSIKASRYTQYLMLIMASGIVVYGAAVTWVI